MKIIKIQLVEGKKHRMLVENNINETNYDVFNHLRSKLYNKYYNIFNGQKNILSKSKFYSNFHSILLQYFDTETKELTFHDIDTCVILFNTNKINQNNCITNISSFIRDYKTH